MAAVGVVVALITVGLALYALYWARKEEVVAKPEEGFAGGEAEGEEATEIGPAADSGGAAIPLESERTPEGVS